MGKAYRTNAEEGEKEMVAFIILAGKPVTGCC
jgi:hypothetical protein